MTTPAGKIDADVMLVARDVIRRCYCLAADSGLAGILGGQMPPPGERNGVDKAERNFFYLALTRALSDAYDAPGPELDALETSIYFLYRHVMYVDAAVDGQQPLLLTRANAYLVLGLDRMRAAIGSQCQFDALRAMAFRQMHATLATAEMERFEGDVPAWI